MIKGTSAVQASGRRRLAPEACQGNIDIDFERKAINIVGAFGRGPRQRRQLTTIYHGKEGKGYPTPVAPSYRNDINGRKRSLSALSCEGILLWLGDLVPGRLAASLSNPAPVESHIAAPARSIWQGDDDTTTILARRSSQIPRLLPGMRTTSLPPPKRP